MITMKEMARLTGVSQATVSRVLNGNTSVNPEARKKVLDCAKAYDYQPNIMAQSLVGSKSLLLGVVIPDIANPFFSDVVKAIEKEASSIGYSILLFNSDYEIEKEIKCLSVLERYRTDGILIVPTDRHAPHLKKLSKSPVPTVVITQYAEDFDSVFISHQEAGRQVAEHLLSFGYSSFIYVGDPGDEKEEGFRAGLVKAGVDMEKHYLSLALYHNTNLRTVLKNRLEEEQQTDGVGIFAYNDVEALIVLHCLQDIGVEIPDKAALVGFDNTFISRGVSPTITSVAQPVDQIGKLAVERLVNLIQGADREKKEYVELSTRIITRETTVRVKRY